jgi:P-type Cu+ transporter
MGNEEHLPHCGILDVEGASCPSCVFAIEKLGRKVPGVSDVRVDTRQREIKVDYDGSSGALEKIAGIVERLGYSARVRQR